MKRLLAADFYCLRKSKLFIVLIILSVALPIFTVLLYLALNFLLKATAPEDATLPTVLFTGKTVISGTFGLSGAIALILPAFSSILVGNDVTSGVLRNKIIIGHTKSKIYFAHLISTIVLHLFIGMIYAGLMALLSIAIFQYGSEINADEVRSLIYFYIVGMMSYVFTASIVSSFALIFKTPAPAILISILVCFAFGLLSSLIGIVDYSSFKYLVYLIPSFANSQLTMPGGIDTVIFIEGLLSYLIFSAAFIVIGLIIFRKKDIK